MAGLLRFQHGAIEAGLEALRRGAPIYADIRMVQVGIQKKGHQSKVDCLLDHGAEIAEAKGKTRTSAGMLALGEELGGSIVVIGNAPSCLLSLGRLIEDGTRPALVVGCPVGFVNAAESKGALRVLDVPSISTDGPRGGTPVAVAAINEIITMFTEMKGP
jgi:precorrin-8X/cobalt-precorrin-8 methylmutase